ncbi:MAG: endolytic transglycosylase MltG [Ignavibacteriales bacterium]|nr:endolytic transglycosylase MltG [Ignavibacteriales bacterium]
MSAKRRRGLSGLLITVLVGCALLWLAYSAFWQRNLFAPSQKTVIVGRGEGLAQVSQQLADAGIIRSSFLFRFAGRVLGYSGRIRSGRFSFSSGMSNLELLDNLSEGKSLIQPSVTLYEGIRAVQIAHILREQAGVDSAKFMKAVGDTSLLEIPNHEALSLEGFLLPDTYEFTWQSDERMIAKRLLVQFRSFFVDSLQRRARAIGYSLREILTIASIVEGETRLDAERPIVAGLYYNRLRKRMRLEADPTIRYLLPNGTHRIHFSDLDIDSPYNTYRNYGLPPTPINNPGRSSILAALYPARHSYLYFVADGKGGHRFSNTFDEHKQNVRLYRRSRAASQRTGG